MEDKGSYNDAVGKFRYTTLVPTAMLMISLCRFYDDRKPPLTIVYNIRLSKVCVFRPNYITTINLISSSLQPDSRSSFLCFHRVRCS